MPSSVLSATASGHDHKPQHKGFRRPILEILDDLKKPVDRRFIKTKTIKGNRIDYIPWMTLTRHPPQSPFERGTEGDMRPVGTGT